MDVDAVVTEVASAVGLAEGRSGVRDVMRAIARREPVATREVSRLAELPIPLVTAVCNELRKRGVVDRGRPVRLTPQGRDALGRDALGRDALGQHWAGMSGRCPCCGGRGVVIPDAAASLSAELERLSAGVPGAKPELDQAHCTVPTKIRRVLHMHEAGALDGKAVILLGDDDLTALAVAAFCGLAASVTRLRRLTVVDTDAELLAFIGDRAAATGVEVELCEHDLREPLPARLLGGFDVACTDPPYTVAGAELFLSRAVSALTADAGQHIFFSFGARRPEETLLTQELIAQMGLTVRALLPGFNEYLGAGVLGGTSHLFHLRTTREATPLISGHYRGPLYTAARRAAPRPYRCAGCRAVHPVGAGARWQRISELKSAGCPDCAGTVFRPMPLEPR
ncbi:MAG TPA: bis-aminopropyl spermidine synthase family protein [Streptosporangiaceae bacterium]|nr:bis-aminopropyl spermidine synthase family protein [Streptosporangiaceae bacterium]